jgi:hypothetical protein
MDDDERLFHDEALADFMEWQTAVWNGVREVLQNRPGWHFDVGPFPIWMSDAATRLAVTVGYDTVVVYDHAAEETHSLPADPDSLARWLDHPEQRGQ